MKTGDLQILYESTHDTLRGTGHRWFHVAVCIDCLWWTVRVHFIGPNMVEFITQLNWPLWEIKRIQNHPGGSISYTIREEQIIQEAIQSYAKIIQRVKPLTILPAGDCGLLINTFLK